MHFPTNLQTHGIPGHRCPTLRFYLPQPAEPPSPFHHNILKLPAELTAVHPDKSFIFNAYSDPPTTTLQRIKGLTTGSLPTFIDMGSNFGGSSIMEDSIMAQMERAGKKVSYGLELYSPA